MKRILKYSLLALGALILVIVIVSVASGSGGKNSNPGTAAPASSSPAAASPAAFITADPNGQACDIASTDAQGYCPGDSPTPAAPAMTTGQQQAVESAQGYLSDGQGFSKAGLYDQLTSSSGEGFAGPDAAFAISYLHPDWNQQAVESAKNYLSDGQGFSRSELYDQLTSSFGEGFTPAQANYAISRVMG